MKSEIQKTFEVAVKLCLVCSVVVSGLAVSLKGIQDRKKEQFRQQSILEAAGLWEDGADVGELYGRLITAVVVDLQTDKASDRFNATDKELELKTMLRNSKFHEKLASESDIAGIGKREIYSVIYEVRENDQLKTLVLPIRGKGLWSTLYGFIALDMSNADSGSNALKVAGLTYYKHAETPGLGGEVDNKLWKAKWPGKSIYDEDWEVLVEVAKNASSDYEVDALAGATLTSNGVSNMLKFWLGSEGFGPYLQSVSGQQPEVAGPAEQQAARRTRPVSGSGA